MSKMHDTTTAVSAANPLYQEILFECKPYYTAHYQMRKHQERCAEEGKKPQYTELKSFIQAIKAWESTREFVERLYLLPLAWLGKRQGGPSVVFDPSWQDKEASFTGGISLPVNKYNELYRPLFEQTQYKPVLLISGEAQSQLFNHLNDFFSRGMAVAQSEDAYRKSQENPYSRDKLLTEERQSRHAEYTIEVEEGVLMKIQLKLPLEAWEIASAIRDIPLDRLYRDKNKNYRLPGWEVNDDIYPWLAEAIRNEIRERKRTGGPAWKRDDTYAQHMVPELWYPAIMKMVGKMQLAFSLALQKVSEGQLPPGKKKPYYKTLLATDIKVIGVDVTIPYSPNTVTLYDNGRVEVSETSMQQMSLL